jgi:hypothetical protein
MRLRNPPAAHNGVRFIGPSLEVTTTRVFNFLKSKPMLSYQPAYSLIHDRIQLNLDDETMRTAVCRLKGDMRRRINGEVVEAFLENEVEIGCAGLPGFDDQVAVFRAAQGLVLPVRPTAIVVADGKFRVLTALGWANPMTEYQIRLWMTVYNDALFSLSDFRNAEGIFTMFPKDGKERGFMIWRRGDYDLVPMGELNDQFDMLAQAMTDAEKLFDEWKRSREPD